MSDPAAKKTSSSWSSISSTIFSPRFRILFSWHLFWVDWAETTWFQNSSNSFVEKKFQNFVVALFEQESVLKKDILKIKCLWIKIRVNKFIVVLKKW
jgi:hypothetical protein